MSVSAAKQKNEKFHAQLVSAEKRLFFQSARQRLLEARRTDRHEEECQAEVELMKMFESRQDFLHALQVYEEYEREREEFMVYLQKLEEESVNFERLMREKEHEEKMRRYKELFEGED